MPKSDKLKALVIVESPAKARTISGYLGDDYVVESSIGHIRDLPQGAAEIPAKYKGESWASLGVDTENDFAPLYIVPPKKREQVKKLKALVKACSSLYLATDEDREGESIAWHLVEELKPKVPVLRMVFHEITKAAIAEAISKPRDVDRNLVDAQEARRVLDRLYGYEVSPVLWKKIMPKLSAGRVQSVATRLIVERERERMAFSSASYWDVIADFFAPTAPADGVQAMQATLVAVDGKRLASGKDFDQQGKLTNDKVVVLDEAGAKSLAAELPGNPLHVASVERKPYRRSPASPFMTSTLQQEASRKLRFSAERTMRTAQRLYETGLITYMRTDSTTLSDTAVKAARSEIKERYGDDYLPDAPRTYKKKVKNAQEAHEAVRPAGDRFAAPDEIAKQVDGDQAALYELIWTRTIACQMKDAIGESVSVRLEGSAPSGTAVAFSASGKVITFPGFLRVYVEGSDDPAAELEEKERHLPPVKEGDALDTQSAEPKGHETLPPARFTEASLVRRLEELGVGRPSTYASILGTILRREYVWKRGSALVPSFKAFAVVSLLESHFDHLVDYAFTARMEDDLDEIARGEAKSLPWLKGFYFGNGRKGLKQLIDEQLGEIDARAINSIPIGVDADGVDIIARVGRYGPYLQRGDDTASIPEDIAPDELTVEKSSELLAQGSDEKTLGVDPETELPVIARSGRFGPYVQLGEMVPGSKAKPKTSSLLKTMDLATITYDDAMKLLSLPREVGADDDGEMITALNGRYGPYLKKATDSRSLQTEEQMFDISLAEAKALFKEPKKRGRQAQAVLREIGNDPSGKPIVLKNGRFGPYVTDGEINASLRTADDPATVTLERSLELIALRRDRGDTKPKKKAKKAPKKAAKKKAGAKKATKKTTKKAGAKKTAKKAAKKSDD